MEKRKVTQLFELANHLISLFKEYHSTNPYDIMQEQIDLSNYFYASHKEDIYRLYHLLVHGMTCLHHLYRQKTKEGKYTSTKEDNLLALSLLQNECFNHDYLAQSVWKCYQELMSYYGINQAFTRKQATFLLNDNQHTVKWQLKQLKEHGYLVRVGGDMRKGYVYKLIDKLNPFEMVDSLQEKTEEKEASQFEEGMPEVKVNYPLS